MRKLIVVPTIRPELMHTFLATMHAHPIGESWRVIAITQEYPGAAIDALCDDPLVERVIIIPHRQAVYPLRIQAMVENEADLYAICDDDIEFTDLTDWTRIERRLAVDSHAGLISGGWMRADTPAFRLRHAPNETWIRQPLVFSGGGMLLRRDAALAAASNPHVPIRPYLFDNPALAVAVYTAGFTNWRYRGTVAVHRSMSKGGIKTLYATQELSKVPRELIEMRPGKKVYRTDNNWHIPESRDLTERAHQLHRENAR